jgi:hypothetical protein
LGSAERSDFVKIGQDFQEIPGKTQEIPDFLENPAKPRKPGNPGFPGLPL